VLVELRVRDLGVIEDTSLALGPGMTALTGETGAGKTLVVEALELLVGGRADPVLVRSGASEARVEGRFFTSSPGAGEPDAGEPGAGETETILARSVPASGRSRAWLDGAMATASALSEAGAHLVDLHGQHSHQSLLDPASQRAALDAFAGIDLAPLANARNRVRRLAAEMDLLGGGENVRSREADLLRFQVEEIKAAAITGPEEDDQLREQEARLSGAGNLRQAAASALSAIDSETSGVLDGLGQAISQLEGAEQLAELRDRARGIQADAADLASDLRSVAETWEDDPARLEAVSTRRAKLAELRRKYGGTLEEVIRYCEEAADRLAEVESSSERAETIQAEYAAARAELANEEAAVAAARRAAAPELGSAVQSNLRTLAMPAARIEVQVGSDAAGDDVVFLLGANPGEAALPLHKVASGGELARTMLAIRLVVTGGRPTLVFDEVDAGIGGAAADAVGRALAKLTARHQVLVVTHLPQVAAFAQNHLVVEKKVHKGRTVASVSALGEEERVTELARMLSGRPGSSSARRHAEELLEEAARVRVDTSEFGLA
jgi:DNA repair protein RecN (Recombination protein N)